MNVAVIGGGFSGLVAAYLLEKEGIEVTLYEKEEAVGGHCKTLSMAHGYFDIGTVCSFQQRIKELLIELKVDYTERFIYRTFVDENYYPVEHMLREDVVLLMDELSSLKGILEKYSSHIKNIDYGYIPKDLLIPLKTFLENNGLKFINQVISPYVAAFGFGNIDEIEAYYVFKVFNMNTIYDFIEGKKSLFINDGTSQLINKLSEHISYIKYAQQVISLEENNNKVMVKSNYATLNYDKVLVTAPLSPGVIKDNVLNNFMKNLSTNTFVSCGFEVENNDLGTTYFKSHLGKMGKVQFLYTTKQNNRTILVAYGYGKNEKSFIEEIILDIEKLGIKIINLIAIKSWIIFPHFSGEALNENIYEEIRPYNTKSNIILGGTLISEPSLDNLYVSTKGIIKDIVKEISTL